LGVYLVHLFPIAATTVLLSWTFRMCFSNKSEFQTKIPVSTHSNLQPKFTRSQLVCLCNGSQLCSIRASKWQRCSTW
jgi:hypothetical protein